MRLAIIALVSAFTFLLGNGVAAADLQLAEGAPTQYTVKKGDTLWAISGKFLKQPWRWPEIWGMNREQIKNPHLIYPGDVIVLDMVGGKPRLRLANGGGRETMKLSPSVRTSNLSQAIPAIPWSAIEPFLTRPLVIEKDGLRNSPTIVATEAERVIIGAGNKAYVDGLDATQSSMWQVYRPGSALRDPETQEVLGYEAIYLGDSRVLHGGEPATVEIVKSNQEINQGDRLTIASEEFHSSYVPHAPDSLIRGQIMSAPGGVAEIGQNAVVTINRGKRDGLEVGNVLASYTLGRVITAERKGGSNGTIKLPDERSGLIFLFRVFDRVSYGLVMQSLQPIHVNDVVKTPEQ